MMRTFLIMLCLAGCHHPVPAPQVAEVPCEVCKEDASTIQRDAGAAVDVMPFPDAPQLSAFIPPDAASIFTETASIESTGLIEPEPAKDPEPESEVEYENGVPVIWVKTPALCSVAGKLVDLCFEKADCAALGARCERRNAFACFNYTMRTSGKDRTICAVTYGKCALYRRAAESDDENGNITGCVVFRVRAKTKAKK